MRALPALLALTTACGAPPQADYCTTRFEATVREGPNAGLALRGLLLLPVPGDDGALAGELYPEAEGGGYDPTPIPATGQATDTALSLVFTTAAGAVLQGTGPLPAPMHTCPEPLEGPLSGPEEGDTGDWAGTCCGNSFCSGTGGLDGDCGSIRCGGCAL